MKRLLLSVLMAGFVYAGQSQEINDWENPQRIQSSDTGNGPICIIFILFILYMH